MLNFTQMRSIAKNIKFKDWVVGVYKKDTVPYLQVSFEGTCSVTGRVTEQKGRKWMLSNHMTRSEFVQTAFLAVKQAMEHEVREEFQYYGEPVYRPHFDVEELWELSLDNKLDYRKVG